MTESTELAVAPEKALATASIKTYVMSLFKGVEPTVTALADKYRDVVYPVTTTKGMSDAIAARADLRENGRLFLTRAQDRIKGDVNDLKRVMAPEVERLVAIIQPVEEAIGAQIKAEEDRKEAEKQERLRREAEERERLAKVEAERKAMHQGNLDKIKSYVDRAAGKSVEDMQKGLTVIEAMTFGAEWEEYLDAAVQAHKDVVDGIKKLIVAEQQRLENEALKKKLADAQAIIDAQKAKEEKEAADKLAAELPAAQDSTQVLKAEAPVPEATAVDALATTSPSVGSMGAGQAADAAPSTARPAPTSAAPAVRATPPATQEAAAVIAKVQAAPALSPQKAWPMPTATAPAAKDEPEDNGARMKLGQINERLAPISLTADGLAELGFVHVATDKRALLYRECDFPAICEALIQHITQQMDLQTV